MKTDLILKSLYILHPFFSFPYEYKRKKKKKLHILFVAF